MTEQEALEKLKKDILELADQKQLLVVQIRELVIEKRVAEEYLRRTRKDASELEIENADRVKKCLLKVKHVLEGAEAKESDFITKLQTLKKWETELAEKEQEQKTLSLSLDNRMVELAGERKKFDEEYATKMRKADEVLMSAKDAADEKYAALSRETAKYEKLVAELDQKQAVHAETLARHDDARVTLENTRADLLEQNRRIQEQLADIQRRENDSSTTLGKQKALQEDLDRRAASVQALEKGQHEKEVGLDLRKRELDSREKKVASLIKIHQLEKEIAELS
jgi:hypothetical protein